ncbi:peptidase C19, ubiquitin carboxyl-terminal hydrolase 2 [Lichtheimia hyalospora FSU 10163]|nr:peptidase C19, ubiquitin carboxyl-terminal hydrolase 2 [Lichtheimia hyalospora FSU 10163]
MRTTEYNQQDPMEVPSPSTPDDQPKIASSSTDEDVFDSTTDQETNTTTTPTPVVVPASTSTEEPNDNGHRSSDSSSISSTSSLFASSHNQTNTATPGSPSFSTNGSSGGELTLYNSTSSNNSNAPANKPKGVCGLTNLGNTCYMNSALQCLSNTPQLSQYFLAGKYKEELNRDNPLGMKGHVAEAYGKLVETLWSGKSSSTAPRDFKHTIGDFNRSFNGYMQHDSQELLAFLLDGLHEDLNRILSKPYRELPDFDNMSDEEIAHESWSYHKARNDSIIVDLFQGQFKSRLTCNTCGKVSTTFDPFMYLSLPLPIQKKKFIKFIYVPYSPSMRPQQLSLEVPNKMTIDQFRDKVAEKTNSKIGASLLVAEVFNSKLYKVLELDDAVDTIGDRDEIYVYQFPGIVPRPAPSSYNSYSIGFGSSYTLRSGRMPSPSSTKQRESNMIVVPIYCRAVSEDGKRDLFGGPMMLSLPKAVADKPDRIRRLVTHQVERYATIKLFEEAPTDQANQSQLQPLPNLFKIKIIPEERSYAGDTNIIPTEFSSWFGREDLEDFEERASKNQRLREKEAKRLSAATNSNTENDMSDTTDDVVGDVRKSWDKRENGRKSGNRESRSNSTSSNSDQDDEPQVAPKTDISQGEGLILDWPVDKAEEIFGSSIVHASGRDSGWNDVDMLNEDIDQQNKIGEKKKNVTLADCLSEFTKEELLSEEDLWYCPRCKEHQRASKKFDLWRLPEILVVHLKRFSHTRSWRDKIDDFIDFPLKELDLTDRVLSVKNPDEIPKNERYVYDLYGVDNHFGGMGGGHYTAYAQNWKDEKWYNFDDSHVSEVDEGNAKTRAAYLLFYKRRRQTPSPSL